MKNNYILYKLAICIFYTKEILPASADYEMCERGGKCFDNFERCFCHGSLFFFEKLEHEDFVEGVAAVRSKKKTTLNYYA